MTKLHRRILWPVLTATCLAGLACDRGSSSAVAEEPVKQLPTRQIQIAGKPFNLEVADDEAERSQGLMFRKSMAADHGMIFVFPDVARRGFWMKNTYIPLDIIYLDAAGRVVSVRQMYPLELNNVPSGGPAKYAIELNQGMAAKIGIKAGDEVPLPADIAADVK